jgi:hypothetical protein
MNSNGLVKSGLAVGTTLTSRQATQAALLITVATLPSGGGPAEEAIEHELADLGYGSDSTTLMDDTQLSNDLFELTFGWHVLFGHRLT